MEMLPIGYYLGVCIGVLCLQCLSILGNGFIVLLFFRFPHLRRSNPMRLVFLLSATDWIFAVGAFPQIVYFVVKWNPIQLNYDPLYSVTTYIPLTIQLKMNLIISLSIAVDRFQAIRLPAYYRKKNHTLNTIVTLIFALIWGLIDVLLEYFLTIQSIGWKPNPGCVAGGCFTSPDFKAYWGTTNMILGGIGILFTTIFAYELRKLSKKSILTQTEEKQFRPANRLSFGILIISALFTMLPSAVVGIVEKLGIEFFRLLGPYYTFSLLCSGVFNSIIEMTFHVEIRKAMKNFFHGDTQIVAPVAVIRLRTPSTNVTHASQNVRANRLSVP